MPKPKSAYSHPTKFGKEDYHIIVVWVDNEAGVLARVVGLFSGRGYNIESLAVAEVDSKLNISRITIVTTGTPQVIEQIKLQLKKLVPVHKVADFKRSASSSERKRRNNSGEMWNCSLRAQGRFSTLPKRNCPFISAKRAPTGTCPARRSFLISTRRQAVFHEQLCYAIQLDLA